METQWYLLATLAATLGGVVTRLWPLSALAFFLAVAGILELNQLATDQWLMWVYVGCVMWNIIAFVSAFVAWGEQDS